MVRVSLAEMPLYVVAVTVSLPVRFKVSVPSAERAAARRLLSL